MPVEEQVDVKAVAADHDQTGGMQPGAGSQSLASSFVGLVSGGASAISEAERQQVEDDKMRLYQQLDDKVSCCDGHGVGAWCAMSTVVMVMVCLCALSIVVVVMMLEHSVSPCPVYCCGGHDTGAWCASVPCHLL